VQVLVWDLAWCDGGHHRDWIGASASKSGKLAMKHLTADDVTSNMRVPLLRGRADLLQVMDSEHEAPVVGLAEFGVPIFITMIAPFSLVLWHQSAIAWIDAGFKYQHVFKV
jgi:hypothetical protein